MSVWPQIVGILNLTPDSFSGDGLSGTPQACLQQAREFLAQGAGVLDVGAESTRPGAEPLTAEAEWQRLEPVIHELAILCAGHGAVLSVDTYHPETARRAAEAGAGWINDVTGLTDARMLAVLRDHPVRAVLTHSLTVPADPAVVMETDRPVEALAAWAARAFDRLEAEGIGRGRLIFDPGIGFGKTPAQSLMLMAGAPALRAAGAPVLIGHSRKSFIRSFYDGPAPERDLETAVLSALMATGGGVDYLRVHRVDHTTRALAAARAFSG